MSLNGALQIGRSALAASQAAIQVAGNNMANSGTVGFHRQTAFMSPTGSETVGTRSQVGTGVLLQSIRREVDSALQSRYRDATSQQSGDQIDQRFLTSIETLQNELNDNDLSSQLSKFFNSFSELANNPSDNAVRNVVIRQGSSLADHIASLRADYNTVRTEADRSLATSIIKANDLLSQIATVNGKVVLAEGGTGAQDNALRDQRDLLLDDLSQYMEISVIEQSNGSLDVFSGSTPIVLGAVSRGIELRTVSVGSESQLSVRVQADGTQLTVDSGSIGGLMRQRDQTVNPAINDIDDFASQLIFQVNRLHSQGQATNGFTSVHGTYPVADSTANLNSDLAKLPFDTANGSFFIHVTNTQTGLRSTHQIDVNGNAMSLNDLINQINTVAAVPNVAASINASGQLQLDATNGYTISFSDDTSGALAALGVNTFFTGSNATDIDVNQTLLDDPAMLAAGSNHIAGSNGTAKAIADLQDANLPDLNGASIRQYWEKSVNSLAVRTESANAAVQSSSLVRDSLSAQNQSVSGVSLDEESISLLTYQRQFQGAAKFITTIDQMLQTLLSIV